MLRFHYVFYSIVLTLLYSEPGSAGIQTCKFRAETPSSRRGCLRSQARRYRLQGSTSHSTRTYDEARYDKVR